MEKTITLISHIISGLTFPLLMPTYAMLVAFATTFLFFLPGQPILTVSLVTLGITAMLPIIAIYFLHHVGIVSDPLLNSRRDRTIPYIVTILSYIGSGAYLWKISAPAWMTAFMMGAAALLAIILFINLVWKISGHAAGMGGLTALSVFLVYKGYCILPSLWLPCSIIVISGIVCSARLLLGRHTLGQVAAGYALAFSVIYLSMLMS